ncbi:MAG: BBP7 family outer membrane beta-barrel protein [Gemmataceae bacterium]
MTSSDGNPLPSPMPTPGAGSVVYPPPAQDVPCATCGQGGYGASPALTAFGPGDVYGRRFGSRLYGSAEFLMWWVRDDRAPRLAVTTPTVPTMADQTTIAQTPIFGGEVNGLFPTNGYGGRFGLGLWFTDAQIRGLETSFFFLGTRVTDATFASDAAGAPNISRPFLTPLGANNLEIVTAAGMNSGSVRFQTESSLYGGDINYRRQLLGQCGCGDRLDLLAGFRYMHLAEGLTITENTTAIPGSPLPQVSGSVFDRFATSNNFYGPQLGLSGELHRGPWSLEGAAKVALGVTSHYVSIQGSQSGVTINGVPSADPRTGGLLALSTNIGNYSQSSFSVVPEATLNLGYQLTPHIKLFVGYTILVWTNVMRPGGQIDPVVDPARIPNYLPVGTAPTSMHPQPTFARSDFWAQGINFGLQLKW